VDGRADTCAGSGLADALFVALRHDQPVALVDLLELLLVAVDREQPVYSVLADRADDQGAVPADEEARPQPLPAARLDLPVQ
jgi:hypothetical protein